MTHLVKNDDFRQQGETAADAAATSDWRSSRGLATGELLLAALFFLAAAYHHLPLGRGPWLIILAWVSLWLRRVGWKGIGFRKYKSWPQTLAIGLLCGVVSPWRSSNFS